MVSSTFYDLRQIRADLAQFITNELGYVPLLSELPPFPVDPDLDTVANCRARVERDADIFVLVIGGRYGSIDDKTDKSITNLEFLSRISGISRAIPRRREGPRKTAECPAMTRPNGNEMEMEYEL